MIIKVKPMKKRFLVLAVILSASTITVVECRKELEPGERCHERTADFDPQKLDGDWTQDIGASSGGADWTADHVLITYSDCQFGVWTHSEVSAASGYWYPYESGVVFESFYGERFDLWQDVRLDGTDAFRFQTQSGGEVIMRRMEKGEKLPVAQ